ncbi:MAG: GreA/GreB family elongation factor [Clostridiales bacterium]|jgi:transcription elongation GreA/GreB family factor|nr:GreA/GreB family elongation factor [Clostridiales bacterium]
MSKFMLARRVYDSLVKHLEEIKKSNAEIVERYYPSQTPERREFEEFLGEYIKNIEELINNSSSSDSDDFSLPMSIMGSAVTVQDVESEEIHKYLIVFPEDFKLEGDDVSLFSPLGKGLILKKVGDIAVISVPAGIIRYKILSVELDI